MAAALPLGIQYLLDAGIFQSTRTDDVIEPIHAPEPADDELDEGDHKKANWGIPDDSLHSIAGMAPMLGVVGSLLPSAPSLRVVNPVPVPHTQPSIFWKAFGLTLKTIFTNEANLSESGSALFCAPPNQAGIISGRAFPDEVTNYQMHLYCDAMQRVGFPTFEVSGDSYFDYVNSYLQNVDETGAAADVGRARQELVDAEVAKDRAWQAGSKTFLDHVAKKDDIGQHSFVDYMKQNDEYRNACDAEMAAEKDFAETRGSKLSSASLQLQVLRLADYRLERQAGNNMPVIAIDQGDKWIELFTANPDKDKETNFDRNLIYYRPFYSIPNYALEVQYWIQGAAASPTDDENGLYTVPLAGIWDRSWSELGHPALDMAKPYVALTPEMKDFINSLDVTLRFVKRTFAGDVTRGLWDVPGLRGKFELPSSAPESIKQPVCKTSRLFFAWGLEMMVKFPDALPDGAVKNLSISALGMPMKRVAGKPDSLVFTSENAGYPVLVGGIADVV
ncbi:hypothetical protein F5X68DRAFT_261908 [Plectosphaerella plurivora]|uniref:Uncharacterized protein n=1 Tax=Plectosphaerella plurivora TaxID=936078 RepID=A0A9P9A8E3_9PEZI|nr:hypothetical protein F5X68DRAFT_261908 [Plectosphaerella plurivora]